MAASDETSAPPPEAAASAGLPVEPIAPAVPLAPVAPTDAWAKGKYDEGLALFAQKQYAAAITTFDAGFAKEPHRAFLFAKGQAQRLAGDCAHAIATYDAFLATSPPPLQIEATHLAIERCARAAAVTPLPASTIPPPPSVTPAWRRPLAIVLWTSAGLALGTGTWLLVSSRNARDDAERAQGQDYLAYSAATETSNARLRAAEIAWVGGLLFAVGGAAYVALARPRTDAADKPTAVANGAPVDRTVPESSMALWLSPAGGGLGFHARF